MRIPSNLEERDVFYKELIQRCLVSREDRIPIYDKLRNYYLFGAQEGQTAPYNKIYPHIDTYTAFLFAGETTRFSVDITEEVNQQEFLKAKPLANALNDEWHHSNADVLFADALMWAAVFNTTHIKVGWKRGIHVWMVDPHNFGVLREDIPSLDRQEAMAQPYFITKSELETRLKDHPKRASIMSRVKPVLAADRQGMFPQTINRVILSATTPSMKGMLNAALDRSNYRPKTSEDLVEMVELWLWDDDLNDYRTVTLASEDVVVYDRANIFVPGEHPFVQVCPNRLYDYYWGRSEVADLTDLQDWLTVRLQQIKDILDVQFKPPLAGIGISKIPDEVMAAFRRGNTILPISNPAAKIEKLSPEMPEQIFREVDQIMQMFDEISGIREIMQGKGQSGVRSTGHADLLARLASARIKKRALIVEASLEKLATLFVKMMKRYDKRTLMTERGGAGEEPMKFIPEQFTDNFIAKVDAHSSSPIFAEDAAAMAFKLLEAKAIDRETLLEMLNPPMVHVLKQKLRGIEAKEQQQAAAAAQAEAQKASKGSA